MERDGAGWRGVGTHWGGVRLAVEDLLRVRVDPVTAVTALIAVVRRVVVALRATVVGAVLSGGGGCDALARRVLTFLAPGPRGLQRREGCAVCAGRASLMLTKLYLALTGPYLALTGPYLVLTRLCQVVTGLIQYLQDLPFSYGTYPVLTGLTL